MWCAIRSFRKSFALISATGYNPARKRLIVKRKLPGTKVKNRVAATKDLTARKERVKVPLFNLTVVLTLWLGVVVLFYSGRLLKQQELVLGQQAPETVVASVDFNAETLSATELKKSGQAAEILPVFHVDASEIDNAQKALAKLLPRLKSLLIAADPERHAIILDSIEDRLDLLSISLTTEELLRIIPPEETNLQAIILSALSTSIRQGIISESELATRFNNTAPDGNITVREEGTETIRPLSSFSLRSDALETAVETIASQLPRDYRDEKIIRELILPWMHSNIIYDADETSARRAQARELVDPVFEPVGSGSVLVRSGDTIGEQTLVWLTAHDQRVGELESTAKRIQRVAASGLLLLIGLGLAIAITGIVSKNLLHSRRRVLVMLTLSALPLLIGKLLLTLSVSLQLLPTAVLSYALPLSIAPILASILLGGIPGILVGLWTSFALAAMMGNSFDVFVLGLLVSVTAVYTTRDVKRRTNLFRAGLWVGAVKIFFALILAVLNQPAWGVIASQLLTAMLSGLACALFALLLIPVFEHLFGITTDIKLLELSDLSHPLLQSLAINAPGTYHHSLMMASLAQNAAEAIGANGLQLRVCAYFHDIGKLVKPGFFSENIQFTENPHDDLAPSMSTLVIVSHIKEGVTLAKKYKLPRVIIDGIEQHQGTSLVSVFYHRAKTQQETEETHPAGVSDEDFRYEGPKPQNREMAILMLADSCEAASRSLDKPTPVRITNLITDIFEARLADGQLDECNLTLRELNTVKQSFVFSLTNMLHGRIAYPENENDADQQPENGSAESTGDSAAD